MPLSPTPLPPTTRLLLTCSGSWFATSLFWGLPLALPLAPSRSRSPAVLLPISLLFLFTFLLLWQLRKFCATAIFVYCVKAAGRDASPRTTAREGCTKCEWQTTARSEHLGNKHKYERAACRICTEYHFTARWHFESLKWAAEWGPNELDSHCQMGELHTLTRYSVRSAHQEKLRCALQSEHRNAGICFWRVNTCGNQCWFVL